jgi:hypothetical protein
MYIKILIRKIKVYTLIKYNWNKIIRSDLWIASLKNAKNGKKIIIATSTGGNWPFSTFESLVAVALTLRGFDVKILLCDGFLDACQECNIDIISENHLIKWGPQKQLCKSCFDPCLKMVKSLNLKILTYSELYNSCTKYPNNNNQISNEHALSGALRYYARGELSNSVNSKKVFDKYKSASYKTELIIEKLIELENPTVVVFHHGIYVPQGVIGEVLRRNNIRIVNWGVSYRKGTVLFSHADSYHKTMVNEEKSKWSNFKLDNYKLETIKTYLKSRETGKNDWITFQPTNSTTSNELKYIKSFDLKKPISLLLTNVIWDAQLHFEGNAFSTMLEWVFFTIDFFIKNSHLQLIIRIHPAEKIGTVRSHQNCIDEIGKRFTFLPKNIIIILPDDNISTYALINYSNVILVYGTKSSIEMACNGKNVIVAGEAWCRNKGFTYDVQDKKHYIELLSKIPYKNLSYQKNNLAFKYAYHLFFRRMIPVKALKPMRFLAPYRIYISNINELAFGHDLGLDIICEGIISGKEFIYDNSEC